MPSNPLYRRAQCLSLALLAVAGLGCARFPDNPGVVSGTRLVFSLTTDGPVRFGTEPLTLGNPYIYIFAINLSTDTSPITFGPKPVVVTPFGNGLMTGDATHFILWDPQRNASQFLIYRFNTTTLETYFSTGVPVIPHLAEVGDKVLRCEVDLSQLEPDATARAALKSIQVNVLTMDKQGGAGGGRNWDAFGDGRLPSEINTAFTMPLTTSGTYNNTRASIKEPRGDQVDPALDLVDWQVEVQLR